MVRDIINIYASEKKKKLDENSLLGLQTSPVYFMPRKLILRINKKAWFSVHGFKTLTAFFFSPIVSEPEASIMGVGCARNFMIYVDSPRLRFEKTPSFWYYH